ncbi:MAG: diacylglycerol kinase [Clostridium sp.]
MMKKKLVQSFNYAIEGIIESIKKEKNLRIHIFATFIVLTACFLYDLSRIEIMIITTNIAIVIVAELLNTAVEKALDAVIDYKHPLVKFSKDAAAGAVLVAASNSVLVGYMVFWNRLKPLTFEMLIKIQNSKNHMVVLVLALVCIVTIIIKVIIGKGTPLKGGMPSGHSAIAFSIATVIAFLAQETVAQGLGYVLALIVAQSRVDSEVHSVLEVIVGSILGTLITVIFFKVVL